jgi:hypothetical protein
MPVSDNAIVYYEADALPVAMGALSDQGDYINFDSSDELWSGQADKAPVVRPNGLVSGGVITPDTTNDQIDITALTCYLAGVSTDVGATSGQAISRPSVDTHQKFSITITSLGAVAVVDGAEGTSFSDTRGANGGPPWIDNDAIEIGQVWLDSQTPALITADEIKQVDTISMERFDSPAWELVYASVTNGVIGNAGIYFHSALAQIHSEDAGSTVAGKLVYASYYTPVFVEQVDAYDFIPPAQSHSINTTQVYGRVKGSKTSTLNTGSFSAELRDGISDNILKRLNDLLWFKFKQNRLSDPYILAQGYLGGPTNFPAAGNVVTNFTIAAETEAVRVYA